MFSVDGITFGSYTHQVDIICLVIEKCNAQCKSIFSVWNEHNVITIRYRSCFRLCTLKIVRTWCIVTFVWGKSIAEHWPFPARFGIYVIFNWKATYKIKSNISNCCFGCSHPYTYQLNGICGIKQLTRNEYYVESFYTFVMVYINALMIVQIQIDLNECN